MKYLPGLLLALSLTLDTAAQERGQLSARRDDDLPRVVVLATGGTIASRAGRSTQVSGYSIGFTGEQLLEMIPGVEDSLFMKEATIESPRHTSHVARERFGILMANYMIHHRRDITTAITIIILGILNGTPRGKTWKISPLLKTIS